MPPLASSTWGPGEFRWSEYQRVAAAGLVDEVHRDREIREYLPDPPDVVAYLLGEEGWVGPGVAHDLAGGEVAVGMVQEELQELELTQCKRHLIWSSMI